jgi:metallo-beta-lactamase family protein
VKCQIRTIHGLSAHADGDELLQFLKPTTGKQTSSFVVHGEVDQSEGFAHRLMAAGIGRAAVPAIETSVIDDGGSVSSASAAAAETGE